MFVRRATVPNRRRAAVAARALLSRAGHAGRAARLARVGAGLMETAVVLFTRDLRVHDHPALAAACANADRVVPLFVLDPTLAGRSANRDRFLHQSLVDLRDALRSRGGDLVVRTGDPVAETMAVASAVGAEGVALSADVSHYARRRERRLDRACAKAPAVAADVPRPHGRRPGRGDAGGGGDHYRVFSPYHRSWTAAKWRATFEAPRSVKLPSSLSVGRLPAAPAGESPDAAAGGETAARKRLNAWIGHAPEYGDTHNDLADDRTSRLSPYLRFGCLSPLEVANAALKRRRLRGVRAAALLARLLLPGGVGVPATSRGATTAPARNDSWQPDEDALPCLGRRGDRSAHRGRRHATAAPRRVGCTTAPGSSSPRT